MAGRRAGDSRRHPADGGPGLVRSWRWGPMGQRATRRATENATACRWGWPARRPSMTG